MPLSLDLFKWVGTAFNLSMSNLSIPLFKLSKLLGTFYNLWISNSSTSDSKIWCIDTCYVLKSYFVA